jgi:hypothetical protein
MNDHDLHCPFLNRSDPQCSRNFSLDRLGYALQYCFGEYRACAEYGRFLAAYGMRRESAGEETVHAAPLVQVTVNPALRRPIAPAA